MLKRKNCNYHERIQTGNCGFLRFFSQRGLWIFFSAAVASLQSADKTKRICVSLCLRYAEFFTLVYGEKIKENQLNKKYGRRDWSGRAYTNMRERKAFKTRDYVRVQSGCQSRQLQVEKIRIRRSRIILFEYSPRHKYILLYSFGWLSSKVFLFVNRTVSPISQSNFNTRFWNLKLIIFS